MFKLVKSDTPWLAFGVSAALIVAQAVDVKKLAGFGGFLSYPAPCRRCHITASARTLSDSTLGRMKPPLFSKQKHCLSEHGPSSPPKTKHGSFLADLEPKVQWGNCPQLSARKPK